ncbi:NAD(P)-binding protein [Novosphingobium decolorationis]|nr:FAD/NAD(P)-binding protein [Novosphingobium decolorationis]
MAMDESEHERLGMNRPIARRSFIGGVAATGAGLGALSPLARASEPLAAAGAGPALAPDTSTYPPVRSGLRGQYPGSFESAHAVRDGDLGADIAAHDTGEHYDLVVVGGGISGLSSAWFYRKALGRDMRILVLDNHDDFGGHAKRNEFHHEGRTILAFGGTMSIESPFPYSYTAKALLAELGIEPRTWEHYRREDTYKGLSGGVFFDKESFGRDAVAPGYGALAWADFFARAPIRADIRAELTRLYTAKTDYLPHLDPIAKAEALKRISLQDFLLGPAAMKREALPFFAGMGFRNNKRVDTCPAYEVAHLPIFDGMEIAGQIRMHCDEFHFPDGNASIARLLVNRLVPGALPGVHDQESIVTARVDYTRLDLPGAPTRLRLGSTAVHVAHIGTVTAATEKAVRVVYMRDGKAASVTAANVVLACFNNIIPYLVPELPDAQKAALGEASKVPMQYTNVLVRNWEPWRKLGVRSLMVPNGYHTRVGLDYPMAIGGYASATRPDQPAIVTMIRNPNQPGLPRKEQHRAGRHDMLATPFETSELEVRRQLQRMLGSAGFDAAQDILAITVNRWPHGYAYTYDTLADPDVPEAERPHIVGRRPFGRIAIANADAGAAAYTNVAIDQAERAIGEVLVSRGLT